MKKTLLSLIIMATSCLTMSAQGDVNLKFGKPTQQELQMTVYEPDPEADAVVLCRLSDVNYTVQRNSYLVDYHEKWRIKVLKPSGARFAKVVVPYQMNMSVGNNISGTKITAMSLPKPGGSSNSYFEGEGVSMTEEVFGTNGDEDVESIKATAFNLEGSKVVKTSLKKSDIVTTKFDSENAQVEFTVPNVKEGTVIEYEYTIHSEIFWQLRDWQAQCEIPVAFAKLDMNIPSYLIFNIEDHGIQRLAYTCTVGTLMFKLDSDPLAKPLSINTNHYVYVGRDLIGMPKDDYVWCAQDHRAGITAELKNYRLPGMNAMDYAKTWEQIDEMILNSDDLGLHLNDHSPLASELKDAKIEEIADLSERTAAVYKLVMSKVKWNGKYELSPALPSETLREGQGSNADINLLLIQSLHDAGLTANPVVLCQREKGLLPYNFPSARKLSTFIVGVVLSPGNIVYVDASSAGGWLNVLSPSLLVERARVVSKQKMANPWVNLQKVSRSQTTATIDATLSADGTLSGRQTTLRRGLAALRQRQQTGRTAEFAPELQEETSVSRQCEVSGNRISLSLADLLPCLPDSLNGNPLTAEKRLMPVEFPAEEMRQVTLNLTLPEGYRLEGEPRQTALTTPDKGVNGRLSVSTTGNSVQITSLLNISKVSHSEKNYDTLRGIFDLFADFSRTPLVFTK